MSHSLYDKISDILSAAFRDALLALKVEVPESRIDPVLQHSRHADFQANAAMGLGKRYGIKPRDLSTQVVLHVQKSEAIAAAEVAGPGFLNISVADDYLSQALSTAMAHPRLGVEQAAAETIVVDYSSPNVAKEMHVGHLRSTVIGDACVRLLEWMGHNVVRRNHIGDWGTPFGMLIEHFQDLAENASSADMTLGDLNDFYRTARKKFDSDTDFRDRARTRVVALQAGDEETISLWKMLVEQSQRYFLEVYQRVDVRLQAEDFRGESAYNDKLLAIVDELQRAGLLVKSDSADCVFIDGFTSREDTPIPLIVRKSDGGFGYAATDLAALRERILDIGATRLLYVVGAPQKQHFEMIFAAGRLLGWMTDDISAEHVAFGSVLGPDGKMLASRSGNAVKLVELLDQAKDKALQTVTDKNPSLSAAEQQHIAQVVGIGAVKYADLSVDRNSDYIFDFDKMLALEGNTAPYLQYANARINSVLRESGFENGAAVSIGHEAEHALALALLQFPDIISEVEGSLQFHRLAKYLFDLATAFSRFYSHCPILKAETPELRNSRLALASHCGATLRTGLSLLGIEAPERM